jgi:hypothetical protein
MAVRVPVWTFWRKYKSPASAGNWTRDLPAAVLDAVPTTLIQLHLGRYVSLLIWCEDMDWFKWRRKRVQWQAVINTAVGSSKGIPQSTEWLVTLKWNLHQEFRDVGICIVWGVTVSEIVVLYWTGNLFSRVEMLTAVFLKAQVSGVLHLVNRFRRLVLPSSSASISPRRVLYPEDEGTTILRSVGNYQLTGLTSQKTLNLHL